MATHINKCFQVGLILLIQSYRYLLSPFVGRYCRFMPSCSAYAIDAIQLHGCVKGSWLSVRRIARCHPWHPGGIDTVPTQQKSTTIC